MEDPVHAVQEDALDNRAHKVHLAKRVLKENQDEKEQPVYPVNQENRVRPE